MRYGKPYNCLQPKCAVLNDAADYVYVHRTPHIHVVGWLVCLFQVCFMRARSHLRFPFVDKRRGTALLHSATITARRRKKERKEVELSLLSGMYAPTFVARAQYALHEQCRNENSDADTGNRNEKRKALCIKPGTGFTACTAREVRGFAQCLLIHLFPTNTK